MSTDGHGAATETGSGREICRTEVGRGKETEVENTLVGSFSHLAFLVPSNAQTLPPSPSGTPFPKASFSEGCCGMVIPQVCKLEYLHINSPLGPHNGQVLLPALPHPSRTLSSEMSRPLVGTMSMHKSCLRSLLNMQVAWLVPGLP